MSSSGAASVTVAMVTTSKDEEEKDDHPSSPHPCLSAGAGPDKYIFSSIAPFPHKLIVVLRQRAPRLIKCRWRAPSWPTPLLPGPCQCARRPRGPTSVTTAFVAVSSYRGLSAPAVRQRRLHLPYVAVIVMSEDEKKKDVF